MTSLSSRSVINDLTARFPGTRAVASWGETALFYNPGEVLPRGVYFATVKERDGDNDRASNLDRPGVFRLNIGLPKPQYEAHFGAAPARPAKGGVTSGDWAFTALDIVTPHPVYAWMGWISVLNPSSHTYARLAPLLGAAHAKAAAAFDRRRR
jgi:hypothetical protein